MEMNGIEAAVAELQAEVERLSRRNAQLEEAMSELGAVVGLARSGESGHPTSSPATSSGDAPLMGRRGLVVALAGAAGGALLGQASPAAAANGDSLRLGQNNVASSITYLESTGGGLVGASESGVGLQAETASGTSPALRAIATNPTATTFGIASFAASTSGVGVLGQADAPTGATVGVIGEVFSTAGTGVLGRTWSSSGLVRGVDGLTSSSAGTGVRGRASAVSGSTVGVRGESVSPAGVAMSGLASAGSGTTVGVRGEVSSPLGTGVFGVASATSGANVGVQGRSFSASGVGVRGIGASSTTGFALLSQGRFKSTGRSFLAAPGSAPMDADLEVGSVSMFLDEAANTLKVRVKYSTGVLKTATVPLV